MIRRPVQSREGRALLIFMKYPEAKGVKTRLSRDIGHENALSVYQKLVRRTLGLVSDFKNSQRDVDVLLFYYPPESKEKLLKSYPGPWQFVPQASGHLGEKMSSAFHYVFKKGFPSAVLIGTDIADIMPDDIHDAFQALNETSAVVGPAKDGGFYLLGLSVAFDMIFKFDSWSTPSVFERTLKCFHASNLKVTTLKIRNDVDKEEDLVCLKTNPMFQDQISIIIPFLDETTQVATLVNALESQLWPGDEIILVKGGSPHGFSYENISTRTRLFFASKGRGNQFNYGVKTAQNNLLWFLHADTVPPPNFGYHIRKISQGNGNVLGCFELSFRPTSPILELISKWANLRTKYFRLPYGDQGLFCSREFFSSMGGFKKQFLMEDVDFVRRCRRMGKLLLVPHHLYSSSKRYMGKGPFRASLQNHLLMLLHSLGISDRRLYSLYYRGLQQPETRLFL